MGRPKRRRPRTRWIVGAVVLIALGWGAAVAVVVSGAVDEARQGMDQVQQARSDMNVSNLVVNGGVGALQSASGNFASAHDRLESPLLLPVRILPVLGRQLDSLQTLSGAAARISTVGSTALSQVQGVLNEHQAGGESRVATLQSLARIATATHAAIARIDLGSGTALVAPLASKRAVLVGDVAELQSTLVNASSSASAAGDILQGPDTYLVLASNNAEMRAGSGIFTEAGVMTTGGGVIHMSGMFPTAELALQPGQVPVSGDLESRWGWLQPGVDWRNLGLTPQFDVNAPLAARMWQADTGQQVDGVLEIDLEGLQQLLSVTGPVVLNGQVVSADNVVQLLEHDQYAGLTTEDAASATQSSAQVSRIDMLGSLASATLQALEGQSLGLKQLGSALAGAAEGRHIMLWSAQASLDDDWKASGVGGELTPTSLDVDLINRGGNKLDQYLAETTDLQMTRSGADTKATLTATLTNSTPAGESGYIAGPYPGLGTSYGEYVGYLAVNLPEDAENPVVVGHPTVPTSGAEGPTWLVAVPVTVAEGQSATVVIHFTMPGDHGALTVVPSGRIPGVSWTLPGGTFFDSKPIPVAW